MLPAPPTHTSACPQTRRKEATQWAVTLTQLTHSIGRRGRLCLTVLGRQAHGQWGERVASDAGAPCCAVSMHAFVALVFVPHLIGNSW